MYMLYGIALFTAGSNFSYCSGLLLRNFVEVTIIQKPGYLLYIPVLAIYIKFPNSKRANLLATASPDEPCHQLPAIHVELS